jgi:hypothetical protein
MTRIAAAILLLSTTAAPAAILCQDAPGRDSGAHWWWRDIDSKRCWFKREGPIPPKSELTWEKEEASGEMVKTEPPPAAMKQVGESIRMLKTQILWEGISEVDANWIDGDAPVDLMRGDTLSGPAGVGGSWVVPPYNKNAGETTSFVARFAPVIESRKVRTN